MTVGTKLLQAAAGNAGEAVYVDDVFSTFLYTGNSTNDRQITNGIDLSGEGGLVWIKNRDSTLKHRLHDTERGVNSALCSNNTDAAESGELTSFNNDGFSLSNAANVNTSATYASWTFRKQEKFFDIVTYTGTGSSHNISHNLNTTPGMVIVKRYDSTADWYVWHRNGGDYASLNGAYAYLNADDQFRTGGGTPVFVDAGMTSTTFGVGTSSGTNANGGSYVAYLFGHNDAAYGEDSDEVIIKCGAFSAGSSAFVENLGFEPQFLIVKKDNGSGSFFMIDNMRGSSVDKNGDANSRMIATDQSGTEGGESYSFGIASKGIGVEIADGNTYIYMAIRRSHKPASEFAANKLFSMDGAGNASGDPDFVSNDHVVDWAFLKYISGSEGAYATARPTGSTYISLSGTAQEYSDGTLDKDFQSGFGDSASSAVANYQAWMFRRAKGFFDVVTYVGTGSATTVSHNLGVAPELILIKRRNGSADWVWYVSALGAGKYLYGDAGAELTDSGIWNNTAPTSSVFSVNNQSGSVTYRINGSGDTYIAVLWATVAGISKVGSYTGTGSDLNVDCGFSAGARFVLIKRTDGTAGTSVGGWYVFDSERGIVAGDDPYFLLNSTAAQVTNTDYIDPLSSGFTVTSSAPAELNASGGNYIFLAIA